MIEKNLKEIFLSYLKALGCWSVLAGLEPVTSNNLLPSLPRCIQFNLLVKKIQ